MTFREVLQNEEAYKLVEQIEELSAATDSKLIEMRESLIAELSEKFNYTY